MRKTVLTFQVFAILLSSSLTALGFPLNVPLRGESPFYAVPESTVVRVATEKARQKWGEVTLGPVIPCVDPFGKTAVYYVCFRLGKSGFPDFDIVLDSVLEGRKLRQEGLRELERMGAPPTPVPPEILAQGRAVPQGKSVKYEEGRRKAWGIGEYGTVLVSARYSMLPIPEYFEGLPRFFTLADSLAEVARSETGTEAELARIVFLGRLDQIYEFRGRDRIVYVDPFPCRPVDSKEFREKTRLVPRGCVPELSLVDSLKTAWDQAMHAGSVQITVKRIQHWEWMPILLWTGGCAPTSASMVLGLWDNKFNGSSSSYSGYGRLIDHYRDEYEYPCTQTGSLRSHIPNLLDELRSAMGTDCGGVTNSDEIAPAMQSVANSAENGYGFTAGQTVSCIIPFTDCWDYCWGRITSEIDSDNPFVWGVTDPPSVGHALAAYGYASDKKVAVYTTWDEQEHWWCYNKWCDNCSTDSPTTYVWRAHPDGGDFGEDILLWEPDGGDNWDACSPHDIVWYQWGTEITKVTLRYSTDGGENWPNVIASGCPSTGEGWHLYTWTPPSSAVGSRVRVKVIGLSSSNATVAAEGSYGNVTIASPAVLPPPQLYSPADGAVCQLLSGTLDWSDVPGAVACRVQLGTSCGSGATHDVSYSHYNYSGLAHDTKYYWRVRTQNACGDWGGWSSCRWFRTKPSTCTPALASPSDGATCQPTSVHAPTPNSMRFRLVRVVVLETAIVQPAHVRT